MNTRYEYLQELFLRAPFYSYNYYDPECLPEALSHLPFRNAIWLASKAFYRQLERKQFRYESLSHKERFSLLKYYNRMCFRPTPFGSFASFSIGAWAENEPARLLAGNYSVLHLLPDLQFLEVIKEQIQKDGPGDQLALNPALYQLGNEYRYLTLQPGKKGKPVFNLEAIPAEPLNAGLIAFCKSKQVTRRRLSNWIKAKSGCSPAEAAEYVDFLIAGQVLLCSNKTTLIGGEATRLGVFGVQFRDTWTAVRRYPVNSTMPLESNLAAILATLDNTAPQDDAPAFYSALERSWDTGGPGEIDKAELSAAVNVLARFSPPEQPAALRRFIEQFQDRFDRRKVPLPEALDPDSGITYGRHASGAVMPAPMDEIYFPPATEKAAPGGWSENHRLLFSRWTAAKEHGKYAPVTLEPEESPERGRPLPSTLAVMFRKTEEHLLIDYAGGASATSLIGRFSLFSSAAGELCRKLADLESIANPDVLFADIDHRSDLHNDNINRREKIYEYSINVNCFAPGPGVLPLNDLELSVRGGELILESRSLGRRIIPRLSTAYNYQLSTLGVFRLLCDLQYQGTRALLPFNMERFFPGLSFYPRVLTGQTILCPAKWKFEADDVKALLDPRDGDARQRIRHFRKEHGLPLKLSLGEFDQQLVFDLSVEQDAQFFIECLKGQQTLTLHEYLPPAKCVKSGNEPLAGQFIAFMFHHHTLYHAPKSLAAQPALTERRHFLLGEEWVYLKIYCTPEVADQILGNVVQLFARRNQWALYCWFFIRYDQDGDHLRLRFKTDPDLIGKLLVDFLAVLKMTGAHRLIRGYQADSYQRELERYPLELIGLVEDVFREGSVLVCNRLANNMEQSAGTSEFLCGLATADRLLRTFLEPRDIGSFCKTVLENFTLEFSGGKTLKTDMDAAYRKLKTEIITTLMTERPADPPLYAAATLAAASKNIPPVERAMLLSDIIHMQMNRNFRSGQRRQEFFVYHCLVKYWSSFQARGVIPRDPVY